MASSSICRSNLGRFFREIHRSVHSEAPSKIKRKHIYEEIGNWKNGQEFNKHILDSIVYKHDGLIAINKPFGISIYSPNDPGDNQIDIKQTLPHAKFKDYPYSIENSLDSLKKSLNVEELKIVKSSERYTSGLVLLSSSDSASKKISKCLRKGKPMKKLIYKYWIVTHGIPHPLVESKNVIMEMVEIAGKNIQPIIQLKFGKSAVEKKNVKSFCYEIKPVAVNKALSCALLQISVTSNKWHFIRVLSAQKCLYLLGDTLYSSRLQLLMGKYAHVGPSASRKFNFSLNPDILSQLSLPSYSDIGIPAHLHLHQIELPGFSQKEDLTLVAPPPKHFLWTCQRLGLLPSKELTASDASGLGDQKFYNYQ